MNIPTKITVSRIIAIVAMLIGLGVFEIICRANPLMFHGNNLYLGKSEINIVYFVVCIVFILAALTDMIDGKLARKWNQVTDLGKFLDPVADKLLVNSMLIFLCINRVGVYTTPDQYVIPAFAVIIMVARDIVVDCLRFVAAKKNVVIAANIFGKAKTVAQMITILLVLLNGWPFYYFDLKWGTQYLRIVAFFVYITTALSLLSGVIYVIQNRKVFVEDGNNKKTR